MSLKFGYVSNGLSDHRLEDALELLAEDGDRGVALTLDHIHLDPLAPPLRARAARLRAEVAALLGRAAPAPKADRPKALIAPHADYAYSGRSRRPPSRRSGRAWRSPCGAGG